MAHSTEGVSHTVNSVTLNPTSTEDVSAKAMCENWFSRYNMAR